MSLLYPALDSLTCDCNIEVSDSQLPFNVKYIVRIRNARGTLYRRRQHHWPTVLISTKSFLIFWFHLTERPACPAWRWWRLTWLRRGTSEESAMEPPKDCASRWSIRYLEAAHNPRSILFHGVPRQIEPSSWSQEPSPDLRCSSVQYRQSATLRTTQWPKEDHVALRLLPWGGLHLHLVCGKTHQIGTNQNEPRCDAARTCPHEATLAIGLRTAEEDDNNILRLVLTRRSTTWPLLSISGREACTLTSHQTSRQRPT